MTKANQEGPEPNDVGGISLDAGLGETNSDGQRGENNDQVEQETDPEAGKNEGLAMYSGIQIQSQEEEIAENKEAWKLAVESGTIPCSDEEDIIAALQEQNEVIAMKRRQAKQKEKIRRSRPKIRKHVCNKIYK
ncbi:hypothetical protein AAHE18_01G060100 [Arachis hypogaea]